MNKRIALLTFALVTLSLGIAAQEAPLMYVVYEEKVKPAQLDAYVEASKTFGELMMAAEPNSEWLAVQLDDFSFYWAIPIKTFADLDIMQQTMMKMMEKAGVEKLAKMMQDSAKTTDYMNSFVAVMRNDLSYQPKTMVPQSEAKILEYNYYYLRPGAEFEAEAIAKEFAAKMKEKGVESGYTLYQLALGSEMPGLAVVVPARSLEELQAINAEWMKKMGADGEALQKKANMITRRFDRRIGFVRADLASTAYKKAK